MEMGASANPRRLAGLLRAGLAQPPYSECSPPAPKGGARQTLETVGPLSFLNSAVRELGALRECEPLPLYSVRAGRLDS